MARMAVRGTGGPVVPPPKIRIQEFNAQRLAQMPELERVMKDAAAVVQLEFLQGLAALHDPARFPVESAAGQPSLAKAAQEWAAGLSNLKRRQVAERAAGALPANLAAVANRFELNVRDRRPIHQQLPKLTVDRPGSEVVARQLQSFLGPAGDDRFLSRLRERKATRQAPQPQQAVDQKIDQVLFRIHRLTCVADTSERFRDEISFTGVASDDEGNTTVFPADYLGKFKKGDFVDFNPPKVLATFKRDDLVNDFPHTFQASIVLSELELPNVKDLRDVLFKIYTAMLLAGYGIQAGALIVTIVAAVAGFAVSAPLLLAAAIVGGVIALAGLLIGVLSTTQLVAPEVFPTQAAVLNIPTSDTTFDGELVSPLASLDFVAFEGHYRLDYTFELKVIQG